MIKYNTFKAAIMICEFTGKNMSIPLIKDTFN